MFSADDRARIRSWILALAERDERVCGGALTGSGATQTEDRWSDVDVAFGVAEGVDFERILSDWSGRIDGEFGVVHHFDLAAGAALYRVILLQNGLEVDIGLWPSAQFAAHGPRFRLVFGRTGETTPAPPAPARDSLIGLCWHHVFHARTAIERGKLWEAEYYVSALRDHALDLACLRNGLPAVFARGTDALPAEVKRSYEAALVRTLDAAELHRALNAATDRFLAETADVNAALAETLAGIFNERQELA
jgi:hypothetical protein